jgi:hypothetical protein
MRGGNTRRSFLQQGAATGAILGLGDLGFLAKLNPVSAAESELDASTLKLHPEVEPVVRLIEDTPRDRLLEEVAARIKNHGLSYRELLAGLLVAGVKNIEPRPEVGFKFHAVLVVNSAHLASMSSPPEHRWLPIFWALDHYKASAQRDVEERGDWSMKPVKEASIPTPTKAAKSFAAAMDAWDEGAADAAVAGLARTAGADAVYEQFFRYGMRDFRSIGHKAIYVANSRRTLETIGWHHAEPVLRSLAYALLMHEGDNPRDRDAEADRPYRRNVELATSVREDWLAGDKDPAATTADLQEVLRTADHREVCDQIVAMLNRGAGPQSIWDALHLASGELLMRQPGIVALHAVTTTNALHYAYQASGDPTTRLLALLQNAAFVTMFREAMGGRGEVASTKIADLDQDDDGDAADVDTADVDAIFAKLGEDRAAAARMTLAHLRKTGDAKPFIDAARVMVFLKGNDAHDYKFSSAVLEDYYNVSPKLRDQYLAANVFNLRSSTVDDNRLVQRTRAALA